MTRGPIHLHIDELVLHGFIPTERHQIADAVERELARLLEAAELRGDIGAVTRIGRRDAGSFFVDDRGATAIGHQVAQALGTTVTGVLGAPADSTKEGRAD